MIHGLYGPRGLTLTTSRAAVPVFSHRAVM